MPGRFGARLADAWEHCLHFALTTRPYFDRESTRRPSLPGVRHKITRDAARIPRRQNKKSGFGHDARTFDPDTALGTNVIVAAGERNDVCHPAAYPLAIPGFFIPLLSPPGSTVLDPFCGSGHHLRGRRGHGPPVDRHRTAPPNIARSPEIGSAVRTSPLSPRLQPSRLRPSSRRPRPRPPRPPRRQRPPHRPRSRLRLRLPA